MRNLPTLDHLEVEPLIQRNYGFQVQSITRHRHTFKLETNLGSYFFKPFHLSETRLQLIVQAKEHLRAQGFEQFTPFVPTLDGKPYLKQGRQLYYLTHWMTGHPANYDSPFDLKRAAQLFAAFHCAAKGFAPPAEMLNQLGRWPEIFKERVRDLQECRARAAECRHKSLTDHTFLREVGFYIEEGERALDLLRVSPYAYLCRVGERQLPFCHHDPAHHNILITEGNQPILVDFDYVLQDLHLHDLGSLIIRNGKASHWNMNRIAYLLKAYRSVKPVLPEEMFVIRAFLIFPYDIWFWARARYIEKREWPECYYQKEWERKTRDQEAHRRFLQNFLRLMT